MKIADRRQQQLKLARAYHKLFSSPDGQEVLADLERLFNHSTIVKKDGIVDPHASLVAAGKREVVLYIQQTMRMSDAPT